MKLHSLLNIFTYSALLSISLNFSIDKANAIPKPTYNSINISTIAQNKSELICSNNRICRKLRQGDKWYPGWLRCCDLGNNRSRWTSSRGKESDWGGSCASWGISSSPKKQKLTCRNLQRGDRWYPGWLRCCDLGNNRSRWTNRRGVKNDWSGSCASWGIKNPKSSVTPCNDIDVQHEYDSNHPKYHIYSIRNAICSKTQRGCTKEKVFNTMISQKRFIAPTKDRNPVQNCDRTVLVPNSPIRTTINSDNYSITNYTLTGHIFYPGKITRQVVDTGNYIAILTTGEGTGNWQKANNFFAKGIWKRADSRLRNEIKSILSSD